MSIEILDNFEDIPLIAETADLYTEGADRCDPLFKDLAIVGLSAICHGVRQSSEASMLDTLEFGELFDESGKFIGTPLARRIDGGQYPAAPHINRFNAGIHIIKAALTASRLFETLPVVNEDYTGWTGVEFIRRRVELPVADTHAAGKIMNRYPVRNIQARVCTVHNPSSGKSYAELDFAAALNGTGSLPCSTATSLSVDVNLREKLAKAKVISGEREGDFVRSSAYTEFNVLSLYAQVVNANL